MDYLPRVKKLQSYLRENALDAFLVLTKVNRQYLSGFTGSAGALLIRKNKVGLYVDDRYTIRARRESKLPIKPLTRLRADLSRKGRGKTGIEDKIMLREFLKIQKITRRLEVTSNVIENIRAVKSKEELRHIAKGSRIIDEIFRRVKRLAKPGITEAAVSLEIGRLAKKLGGDGLAFDPIVAFGANAASPHQFSENRKIGKNNFLLLDFGVLVKGYHSDFTRTLFIGKPNRKQEKIYHTVLEAQLRAIEATATPSQPPPREGEKKEGVIVVKAKDIDSVARRFIGNAGFGKYFTHNTGHGVGLEIHELPNFSPDSTDILQKDMVVTVEPGIYLPQSGGVRIEDMVIVGEKPRVLSEIHKDLKSMVVDV
ncbi:MAG: aminopeptidase P family protein [Candidatus Doudnabacteria bacterium]|nr:aminopeptidase P family protein [Candidatus Doudnabacteria bacterium]